MLRMIPILLLISSCSTVYESSNNKAIYEKEKDEVKRHDIRLIEDTPNAIEAIKNDCGEEYLIIPRTPYPNPEKSVEVGISIPIKDPKGSHPMVRYRCIPSE